MLNRPVLTQKVIKYFLEKSGNAGGSFPNILNKSQVHFDNMWDHLEKMHSKGGALLGGGIGGGGISGGKLNEKELEPFKNHKDMYHFVLNLDPAEFELLREIASQILGANPSDMWDDYNLKNEKLESDAENYEHIMRMPNSHAAARLIEAENGTVKGGGFLKAMNHVIGKAGKVYNFAHKALGYANKYRGVLDKLPFLNKYSDQINSFLDMATKIDDIANPLVKSVVEASQGKPSDEKQLRKYVKESVHQAVQEEEPTAEPLIRGALELTPDGRHDVGGRL